VRGTDLFRKIEIPLWRLLHDEDHWKRLVENGKEDLLNGETFYLLVGTSTYTALGVLIAFGGERPQ